jgi:hypothetical protein
MFSHTDTPETTSNPHTTGHPAASTSWAQQHTTTPTQPTRTSLRFTADRRGWDPSP